MREVAMTLTTSSKLGIASGIMAACAVCFLPAPLPISFICSVLSAVLGFIAAQRGSKWWLTIPSVLVIAAAMLLYVGLHAT
jgi:energy-coupling factor transporter transmembrane protein EcfT